MTQTEALKLAREGVEIHSPNSPEYIVCAALIEALAQSEQEPVADVLIDHEDEDGHAVMWLRDYALNNGRHLLYTTPPQRKPLSEAAIEGLAKFVAIDDFNYDFARAIEKAHGIKE